VRGRQAERLLRTPERVTMLSRVWPVRRLEVSFLVLYPQKRTPHPFPHNLTQIMVFSCTGP
jgi:hypothetical protein